MAVRKQLYTLPPGTILTDKISETKYILLQNKYKIVGNKTSDGVLLGFYSNGSDTYFTNQIYDTLLSFAPLYNFSQIKDKVNSLPTEFKTSDRLKERILPTTIMVGSTMYDEGGPMFAFIPSLRELGTPIVGGVTGISIPSTTTDTTVLNYINRLKADKILTRDADTGTFKVFLSDGSQVTMSTPQNLVYFITADPTIYVGVDEDENFYLFDNFYTSIAGLQSAIDEAEALLITYNGVPSLVTLLSELQNVVDNGKQYIINIATQEEINRATKDILEVISLLEVSIRQYELDATRIIGNIAAINTIIDSIDNLVQVLTANGNISNPIIEPEITAINNLKIGLTIKINNLTSRFEPPMDILALNTYITNNFNTLFSIENIINQKLIVSTSRTEIVLQLSALIQECVNLISKYTLVDNYYLQLSINNSNTILTNVNSTINELQKSIIELSDKKQQFINNIKFETNTENLVLEIGLLGRRPVLNITLINNTGLIPTISIGNNTVIQVGTPIISNNIMPLGTAQQYPIIGLIEGTTQITFTINEDGIDKTIIIPILVSVKDTVDPSYLDLVDDIAKVSIQQIDSGLQNMSHLGIRLEEIEKKLFSSSTNLDPNLLNILNTTTPTPILNNIEMIIVRDADITNNRATTISLKNEYYLGRRHLVVYRNGVFQQLGVKYREDTNTTVIFDANYLVPGDKLLFITSKNGMSDLSNIWVEHDQDNRVIKKITFVKDGSIFREIEFKYDDQLQITEQIITDELYIFTKEFIYDNDLITDINISITKK